MSSKTSPIVLRLPHTRQWNLKWSVNAKTNKQLYTSLFHEDLLIKDFLQQFCSKIKLRLGQSIIKRSFNQIFIFMYLYNNNYNKQFKFNDLNQLNKYNLQKNAKLCLLKLSKMQIQQFTNSQVYLYITQISQVITNPQLLANFLASQFMKKRISVYQISKKLKFLKTKSEAITQYKVLGYKAQISGRINGVNRARTIRFTEGKMPLNTFQTMTNLKKTNKLLNVTIDYATSVAYTKYGTFGIKVWIAYDFK